ncbi:hypothetical protein [Rhizobium sp. YK2]|uniref:hypothetical protein n=1 Tax=Rhizobium sp. YK2 TaxID=1860096 RepID=UPI00084C5FA2|nr:hypothetical protein [Rhizobium sp. YK2]OEC94866.1 hypothetical protein A9Z06_07515 [Rhizobium sp. YK2]
MPHLGAASTDIFIAMKMSVRRSAGLSHGRFQQAVSSEGLAQPPVDGDVGIECQREFFAMIGTLSASFIRRWGSENTISA